MEELVEEGWGEVERCAGEEEEDWTEETGGGAARGEESDWVCWCIVMYSTVLFE
jgi:hypothetical protein